MEKQSLWQKAKDKIRNSLVKLAIVGTTVFGYGSAGGMPNQASSPSDKNINTTEAATSITPPKVLAVDMDEILANQLITEGLNVIGNFNLKEKTFTPEELHLIEQCDLSQAVLSTARTKVRKGTPKKGEQTYCLGAVKDYFAANGITIDAQRFAYRAVEGLQNNDYFTELKGVKTKNLPDTPDGAAVVFERGTTRYGHILIKDGTKELCDFRYNLRTNNLRGSSGQRYGDVHVFVLNQMKVNKKLVKQLIQEGLLKEEIKQKMLAHTRINNMRAILGSKHFLPSALADGDISSQQVSLEKTIPASDEAQQNNVTLSTIKKLRDRVR